MENAFYKRTNDQYEKHLLRCDNCKTTASFCYRPTSLNNYDILHTFFHCHSYFCETCARKKKGKLLGKIKNVKPGFVLRFVTLTLSTEQYTPEEALDKISTFFNLWVKYMRYRGFKFQYFKIIEFTQQDQAHIHALITCYMDAHIISYCWMQITGSFKTDIRICFNLSGAIRYIMKYMTKSICVDANFLFYMMKKRRYSYSQGFFLPAHEEPPFIQSKVYFFNDFDLLSAITHFFRLHFNNYPLIRFNLLN